MRSLTIPLLTLFIISFVSCSSPQKTFYFANQGDASINASNIPPRSLIEGGDILSITVFSLSQQSLNVFNTPNLTDRVVNSTQQTTNFNYTGPGASSQLAGYLVSAEGYIKFPMLGKIKVAGLNKNELEERLTAAIMEKKLLLDPIITVRQLNFRVTVIGEVARPTTINVPSERISLLEALGMAGDLTIYGKRENVLIIREENNMKVTKRINLNSTELFESPYYYLKPNDVVYVEPSEAKIHTASEGRQILPIVFSALSVVIVMTDLIVNSK